MGKLKIWIQETSLEAKSGDIGAGFGLLLFTLLFPVMFPFWLIGKGVSKIIGYSYGFLFPISDEFSNK